MKKIVQYFLLIITVCCFSFITQPNLNALNSDFVKVENCRYGQCNATAKSTGNRCRHCVSNEGDLYCWQHK